MPAQPILVGTRVRPVEVSPPTGELGYPQPHFDALAALSLDSPGARHLKLQSIADPALLLRQCALPLAPEVKYAVLACRNDRLGQACSAAMRNLTDEMWVIVFAFAAETHEVPNSLEVSQVARGDGEVAIGSVPARYTFDLVFDATASTEAVYECVVAPQVAQALKGYNAALIAFGPCGSGKSYTIEGAPRSGSGDGCVTARGTDAEGVMRKAIRHAFIELHRRHGDVWGASDDFARFSCFAVHKRVVYDMLAPDGPTKRRIERTDAEGKRVTAFVEGLHAPRVASAVECNTLLDAARAARHRLPVCPSCANWTRDLDMFWTMHVRAGPLGGGSLSFVKLAFEDRRQRCNECRPIPTTNPMGADEL